MEQKNFIKKRLFSIVEDPEGLLVIVDENDKMICFLKNSLVEKFIYVFEKDITLGDSQEEILKAKALASELRTHI